MKQPSVYIMANRYRGAMYTGFTPTLVTRVYQHKNEITKGHSTKYGVKNLVYYEMHETMESAILREKKLKRWKRDWKYDLIEKDNPTWKDLYPALLKQIPEDVIPDLIRDPLQTPVVVAKQIPDQVRDDGCGLWDDGVGLWVNDQKREVK